MRKPDRQRVVGGGLDGQVRHGRPPGHQRRRGRRLNARRGGRRGGERGRGRRAARAGRDARGRARLEHHGEAVRRRARDEPVGRAGRAGDGQGRGRHAGRAGGAEIDRVDRAARPAPGRRERRAQAQERHREPLGALAVGARDQRHRGPHGDRRAAALGPHVERAQARLQHRLAAVGDRLDVERPGQGEERQHRIGPVGERGERRARAHPGHRVGGVAQGEDDRAAVFAGDDRVALAGLVGDRRAEPLQKAPHAGVTDGHGQVAGGRDRVLEHQARALKPQAGRARLRRRAGRARQRGAGGERGEPHRTAGERAKNSHARAVHRARGVLREASPAGSRRCARAPPCSPATVGSSSTPAP